MSNDIASAWTEIQDSLMPGRQGCMVWLGDLTQDGYGIVRLMNRVMGVHQIAYIANYGNVPAGLEIDHLCRNRACCNPLHLEAVTHQVNVLRGVSPHAKNAQKTHCPSGHPYEGRNLVINAAGSRRCRTCKNTEASARYNARKQTA